MYCFVTKEQINMKENAFFCPEDFPIVENLKVFLQKT